MPIGRRLSTVSRFRFQAWRWKMGPIGYPETSITNYLSTLRNTPEECRSQNSSTLWLSCVWCSRLNQFMRREEKPTRCHWKVYCIHNMLSMFRRLLCPSSGARDYMCVITTYGVQCLGCLLLEVRCRAAGYEFGTRDVARATSLIPNA